MVTATKDVAKAIKQATETAQRERVEGAEVQARQAFRADFDMPIDGNTYHVKAETAQNAYILQAADMTVYGRWRVYEPVASGTFNAPSCYEAKTLDHAALMQFLRMTNAMHRAASEVIDVLLPRSKGQGAPLTPDEFTQLGGARFNLQQAERAVARASRILREHYKARQIMPARPRQVKGVRALVEAFIARIERIATAKATTMEDKSMCRAIVNLLQWAINDPDAVHALFLEQEEARKTGEPTD